MTEKTTQTIALLALLHAVAGHKLGLFVTEHQSCTDGIETESQFLPHG